MQLIEKIKEIKITGMEIKLKLRSVRVRFK